MSMSITNECIRSHIPASLFHSNKGCQFDAILSHTHIQYTYYYSCTAVCILTEPFFHSERWHSCDLLSCRWKCKYIQSVSHHHFYTSKPARITGNGQSQVLSCISHKSRHLPVSLCLVHVFKMLWIGLITATFKPSKLVLQLICIIQVFTF